MEKESSSTTSSDTTINLSSVKEVVSKSSTKLTQSLVSSNQNVEIGQEKLGSLMLMGDDVSGDVVGSTKEDNAIASNLANQILSFKIDPGVDGISSKEAVKLSQMEQNVSSSMVKQTSKSSIVNMQSSSMVSAETTTASEVDSVDNSPKTEELRKPEPEPKTVAADTIVNESAKHENINNTLREIISDIDTNIKEDEAILLLKKEEQNLLKKHEELTKCIEEQQQLAKKLAAENQKKLEELNKQQAMQQLIQQNQQEQRKETTLPDTYTNTSVRTENTYMQSKDASYSAPISQSSNEPKDFSNGPKQIDLNKIFTPATDNVELCQKNRKLYASSAFYSPSLHPTVEDQVELARRISHSLSDISNQTSKGQSMYDNRKKRSVKWVHESIGQGTTEENDFNDNAESQTRSNIEKIPLRLVMNPRGHVIDFNSVQESVNTKTGLLSPDRCAELVYALQTQKGKGAELFAKRRKKSDKWIIDETNAGTQSPSGIPDHNQVPANKSPVSPSILPAYSEAGKHRVQLNMHQQQVLEKYGQPSLTVVKTPWEAALETGSASTAFVEDHTYNSLSKPLTPLPQSFSPQPTSTNFTQSNIRNNEPNSYLSKITATREGPAISNPQRDLAYKPSVAQGWNAPTVTLPKHMFVPKEIPLENYAPPPVAPGIQTRPVFGGTGSNFPASVKQQPDNFPRNTQWQPTYIQNTSPVPIAQKPAPQVNFNPSPLSHEKLSKFENKTEQSNYGAYLSDYNPNSARTYNTSPAPFGGPAISPNSVQNNWNPNKNIEIRKSVGQPPNRIYNNNNKTFNNLARGWGCGNNYGCSSPIKQHTSNFAPKMGGTTALPYTDF